MIMLVHHLATILLITFSYTNNMVRAGTLVMCLHDASDIFLEVKVNPAFKPLSPALRGNVAKVSQRFARTSSDPSDRQGKHQCWLKCLDFICIPGQEQMSRILKRRLLTCV